MIVVSHLAVSEPLGIEPIHRRPEDVEKRDPILIVNVDRLAPIPARSDVVYRAGELYAEGAGHEVGLLASDREARKARHDPFFTRFEVSRRIREEFENGKHYYALHGQRIEVPDSVHHRPDPAALRWHNEECFKG